MKSANKFITAAALMVLITATAAHADDWDVYLTVDNQFDVYYGTSMTTNFHAGYGNNWATEYNYTALGRPSTDYLYVATASDYSVAQGFIGTFHNTTLNATISTGSSVWEVFPAGQHLQQLFGMPGAWPANTMPTQAQVDAAIAYATTNSLWVAPTTVPGYDNDPSTPIAPYTFIWPVSLPNVETSAQWIWYDSGRDSGTAARPAPFNGFNHDEFLVFRVPGIVPEPASIALLALGAVPLLRRRPGR
jgi:hypothetical protein